MGEVNPCYDLARLTLRWSHPVRHIPRLSHGAERSMDTSDQVAAVEMAKVEGALPKVFFQALQEAKLP